MANTEMPFMDVNQLLEHFRVPGMDVSAIIEARRKDMEALVTANRHAYEGMQLLGRRQTEMLHEAIAEWQARPPLFPVVVDAAELTQIAAVARRMGCLIELSSDYAIQVNALFQRLAGEPVSDRLMDGIGKVVGTALGATPSNA